METQKSLKQEVISRKSHSFQWTGVIEIVAFLHFSNVEKETIKSIRRSMSAFFPFKIGIFNVFDLLQVIFLSRKLTPYFS